MFVLKVQVGRSIHYNRGCLKKVRSLTLSVTVNPTATVDELIDLAAQKHRACDNSLPRVAFYLLFPNGQRVICIPENDEPFSLLGYKNFIGKPYSKLVLFICPEADYIAGKKLLFV